MEWWQVLALIICAAALVQGDYILEIRVHRFQNPTGERFDGRCCDDNRFDNCSPCENMFLFCLRPPFFPNTSNNCPLGSYTTGVVTSGEDPDDLQFPIDGSPIDTDVPNPLIFSGTEWPGGFQLYTRVEDEDVSLGEEDLIDRIFVEERNVIPSDDLEFSRALQSQGEFEYGYIFVTYRVMCTGTSGGPNCTIDTETDTGTGSHNLGTGPSGNAGPGITNTTDIDTDAATTDLDPCGHSLPCQNGGSCLNTGLDMYECSCADGFEGVNCELNRTDECDPDPCENEATCMDLVADYSCSCPLGFIGINCERGEGEGSSSEGVDAVTLAGGVIGIVLLILVLVVVFLFVLRRQQRKKVQITGDAHPTTNGTINLKLNPVYGVSTTQAQISFPEVIALKPNPVYVVLQETTEYYMNEDMGPVEPPQYDYPVVQPLQYDYPVVQPLQYDYPVVQPLQYDYPVVEQPIKRFP